MPDKEGYYKARLHHEPNGTPLGYLDLAKWGLWKSADGSVVAIVNMTDLHLKNSIGSLQSRLSRVIGTVPHGRHEGEREELTERLAILGKEAERRAVVRAEEQVNAKIEAEKMRILFGPDPADSSSSRLNSVERRLLLSEPLVPKEDPIIAPGLYRHYKGDYYQVLGVAHDHHGQQGRIVVIYLNMRGEYQIREIGDFQGQVKIGRDIVPRFERLTPKNH